MSAIFKLTPDNVTPLWGQIEALLRAPVNRMGTHEPDDVRKMAMTGAAQMWIQYDSPIVEAVVVTEFVQYPKGLYLRAWLAGGSRDYPFDNEGWIEALTQFGEVHRVKGLEIIGRMGWLRRIPGLAPEALLMRLHLEDKDK